MSNQHSDSQRTLRHKDYKSHAVIGQFILQKVKGHSYWLLMSIKGQIESKKESMRRGGGAAGGGGEKHYKVQ